MLLHKFDNGRLSGHNSGVTVEKNGHHQLSGTGSILQVLGCRLEKRYSVQHDAAETPS